MLHFAYSFWWLIFAVPLVPLLIHLINLLRHEQRPWAAMEFLLKSHKKHSQYVWLMQFLLLLLRMVIAVALVALLAQLTTPEFSLLGKTVTHHYVLLDDTYSMGDRGPGESAFERAQKAVSRIAANAKTADGPQRFTLIRYSRAATAAPLTGKAAEGLPPGAADPSVVDINSEFVDLNFDEKLEEKRRTFDLTLQTYSPLAAIRMAQQLIAGEGEQKSLVYLVSDFRKGDWDNPADVRAALQTLTQKADLQLVACVEAQHANLGITHLAPEERTRAAGVPLFVDLHVKNFGTEVARDVQVKLNSTYYGPLLDKNIDPLTLKGAVDELPPVFFKEIPPGETAYSRTQVYFPTAGEHVVEAVLPEDSVPADNRRWCVVDFPAGNPVLVIDGQANGDNKYFLTSAFTPAANEGGATAAAKTGIMPEVKTMQELRDMTLDSLRRYHAVYLLDVPRFDVISVKPGAKPAPGGSDKPDEKADPIVQKLEDYVRGGGGIGVFLGPDVEVSYYNRQLYRGGTGFFPLPLGGQHSLEPPAEPDQPHLDVIDHPVFRVFFGERNANTRRLEVAQYFQPVPKWTPSGEPPARILATLYNRQPLAVERQFGEGKVIAFLSSLAPLEKPQWNNWARDPAFIVMLLELQSYLQGTRRSPPPREVGTPLELDLAADAFNPSIKFLVPSLLKPEVHTSVSRDAMKTTKDSTTMVAVLGKGGGPSSRETSTAGIYEAWIKTAEGDPAPRRYAFNVDPKEGELALVGTEPLLKSRLPSVPFTYRAAWQEDAGITTRNASSWSEALLIVLILLLIGEQALAFVASFHPTPKEER